MGSMTAANLLLVQKYLDAQLDKARINNVHPVMDPPTYNALSLVVTATAITTA